MEVIDGALGGYWYMKIHNYMPPPTKQQAKTKKCDFLVNDSSTFTLVEVVGNWTAVLNFPFSVRIFL